MKKKKSRYRHYVPAKQPKQDFPFTYDLSKIENPEKVFESKKPDITINYIDGEDFKGMIREELVTIFDFSKYLDEDSEHYIGKKENKGPTYTIKVEYCELEEVPAKTARSKPKYTRKVVAIWGVKVSNFSSTYAFTMVKSIEHLEKLMAKDFKRIAVDTEDTGLDPDVDYLVGVTFAFEPKKGYYLPVAHKQGFDTPNLGLEAVEIFYNRIIEAERVYMFNSRFDMRFFEFTDKKFDMSKIKLNDVQVNCYLADPDYKQHSLKALEKHWRGYYRPDLESTLRHAKIKTFNTALIDPKNLLFYAAQDGISTYEIGEESYKYYEEMGIAGQIDQALLYPLMKMENHAIRVDVDYLKSQLDIITPRLDEINQKLTSLIGDINLNSPQQKQALFESFGLDTGVRTATGSMSTGQDAVDNMIEKMEADEEDIPEWLQYLGERSKLEKLKSTYFGSLYEQAQFTKGRVRFNYRNTVTSTGRLSSGQEKEN